MVYRQKLRVCLALVILVAMLGSTLAPAALAAGPAVPARPGRKEGKPIPAPDEPAQPATTPDVPELGDIHLTSYDCASQTEIPVAECEALVALYNASGGATWTTQTNWLQSDTPSNWHGVTVLDGHVALITLPWNNLNGSLPDELGNLSELQTLELQANSLSGAIPITLGNLTTLVSLNLSYNQLSGSIPSELGNLTSLEDLYLSTNGLSGAIPSTFGSMAQIKNLVLPGNQLTGGVPVELTGLANLFYLDLGGNQLTGEIPSGLGANPGLSSLGLSSNQLSGAIPSSLGDLSQLVYLDLSGNGLTGSIPTALSNATLLQHLDLGGNDLSGGLPVSLGTLTSLTTLDLAGNALGGSIPGELGALGGLEVLDLSSCALSGSMPVSFGGMLYLQSLDVSNNSLSGAVPAELGALLRVETLDLSHNQFSGDIPASLGGMLSLQALDLSYNQLSGSIPLALGDLSTLNSLDLSHNQLSGEPPAIWSGLTEMDVLRLSYNNLSGSIPASLNTLQSIEWLAMDHNQFTGTIPAGLGDLGSLYDLDLGANQLSGVLPVELGSLRNLNRLSLHNNALEAPIPQALTLLTGLATADLGYNRLATTDTGVRDFLNAKDPDWQATQTVPPTNLRVTEVAMDRFSLAWTPILYTGDDGHYEVSMATVPGGPYAVYGATANKSAASIDVTGLLPTTTYYVVVRTKTSAHGDQVTTLFSGYTAEAAATTALTGTFDCADVVEVPCSECDALEALYVATDGANWQQRDNWLQTTMISAWEGVSVAEGHVTALTLSSNDMSGALPPEIGDLTELTALYMGYNDLTGELPATLGSLSQADVIDLRENNLSGQLPTELGNLTSLQTLLLQDNQLSGAIPAELGALGNLAALNLSANQLSGEIPAALGSMSGLKTLLLNGNSLSGAVPQEMGNLSALVTLSLSHNALSGDLPATLANLTMLGSEWWAAVDLGYNRLTVSDPTAAAFLDQKDPDWRVTQTVTPTDVAVDQAYSRSVRISWTPIDYMGDAGHYQVSIAGQSDGPWTVHGATVSKAMDTYLVDGLDPSSTYWFQVRTTTDPHDAQANTLWSDPTTGISATTASEVSQAFLPLSSWIRGYGVTAGGWTSQNIYPRTLGDVNGDGLADIVGFGARGVYVSLSDGQQYGDLEVWVANYGVNAGGWEEQNLYPRMLGDVNGDGKQDIVAFGDRATFVSLSTGSSFEPATSWINAYGISAGGWVEQNIYPRALGDVNGDGKDDIVGFGSRATYVSLSTGSGFEPLTPWINAYGVSAGGWIEQNIYPRMLGDVNGDGRDDIVGFGARATYVSLSTGSGFEPVTPWINGYGVRAGGWIEQNIYPRMLGDVNGDGRDDIVGCGKRATFVSLSTGVGFDPLESAIAGFGVAAGGWLTQDLYPRVTGDVNGDGQQDLLGFGNRATFVSLADW